MPNLSPLFGGTLALAALVAGWIGWGWHGLALAFTVIVFWLLLQFNQALRVMRNAGRAPVGHVDSAVMLNARLRTGMQMLQVLALTRALGRKLSDEPETYVWTDAGGADVVVTFTQGRCSSWLLHRPTEIHDSTPP